jgi:hypothetical protein
VSFPTALARRFPTLLAEIETTVGTDTCFPRYLDLSGSSARVVVAEEQSRDDELRHTLESLVFLSAE